MPRSVGAVFVYSCFFLLAFASCVDNEPIIDEARVSVVVDYSGETVEARLSVFANVKSDLDLAAEIRLVNEEAGLEWACRDLTKFQDSSKNDWAGWASFVAPEGEGIAKGRYVLTYEDTCEREGEVVFVVNYPDALLERIQEEQEESTPSDDGEGSLEEAASDGEAAGQNAADGSEGGSAGEDALTGDTHQQAGGTPMPPLPAEDGTALAGGELAAEDGTATASSGQPSEEDVVSGGVGQVSEGAQADSETVAQSDDEAGAAEEGGADEAEDDVALGDTGDETDEEIGLELKRKKPAVFKSKTIDEARAILGKGAQKKIALYSADRQLLYFGEQEDDTLSQYKEAAFCKTCLCTQDDAVICVFSETPVSRKKGK